MKSLSIRENLIALAAALIATMLAFGAYFATNVWVELAVVKNQKTGTALLKKVWPLTLAKARGEDVSGFSNITACLLYTSPSPRDLSTSRMPSSA